ncbi:MAG: chalcone isomerase family protein [Rhodoferax sp.]|uniref:chalcone isomerase family protein n=1 Tax=Rhodoferax sp. TaxID=50421 RepID=UPI0026043CD0|nr:chalcone isomerase family protein [Rhodoferax sp.]MDD2881298.1 chalcone isomerase family protein [Rhodoferax sp.]
MPAMNRSVITLPMRRELLAAAGATLAGWPLNPAFAQADAVWPEVSSTLADARLAGTARLRVWGFEVYDAQLWVGPGFRASQFAQFPLALSLRYLRALKGVAIAERSLREMRGIAPIPEAQASQWLSAMTQTFADVQAGDRLTGLHQPAVGARFWLNGQPHGSIADARFSASFFGIWLAQATSEPALRRQLLAGVTP